MKLATGILLSALLLAVSGCGGDDDNPDEGRPLRPGETLGVLRDCFDRAGAQLARSADDLRFAREDVRERRLATETYGVDRFGTVTIELRPSSPRRDYRVFATYREDRGIDSSEAITSPERIGLVTYLPPPASEEEIAEAERCID